MVEGGKRGIYVLEVMDVIAFEYVLFRRYFAILCTSLRLSCDGILVKA
jgi:hypothetical protein